MRASRRLSGQFPDQRSGTKVTARPDEQLAPNRPICSRLALYMAMRLRSVASRTGVASWVTSFTIWRSCGAEHRTFGVGQPQGLPLRTWVPVRTRPLVVVHDGAPGGAVEVVVLAALE